MKAVTLFDVPVNDDYWDLQAKHAEAEKEWPIERQKKPTEITHSNAG